MFCVKRNLSKLEKLQERTLRLVSCGGTSSFENLAHDAIQCHYYAKTTSWRGNEFRIDKCVNLDFIQHNADSCKQCNDKMKTITSRVFIVINRTYFSSIKNHWVLITWLCHLRRYMYILIACDIKYFFKRPEFWSTFHDFSHGVEWLIYLPGWSKMVLPHNWNTWVNSSLQIKWFECIYVRSKFAP